MINLSQHAKNRIAEILGIIIACIFALIIASVGLAMFGLGAFAAEPQGCNRINAHECANRNTETLDAHDDRINDNRDAAKHNRETNYAQDTRINDNRDAAKHNRETNYAQDTRINDNRDAAKHNRETNYAQDTRIDAAFTELNALSDDVDAIASGVAMAVAIANAPIVTAPGKHFSLSGGVGYFHDKFAAAIKFAVVPTDFTAVNVSVGYDFDKNVTVGAGAGFAF